MARYFTRPARAATVHSPGWDWQGWDHDHGSPSPVSHLEVSDFEDTDTGLLDHHGDSILRAPNVIGFGREDEW